MTSLWLCRSVVSMKPDHFFVSQYHAREALLVQYVGVGTELTLKSFTRDVKETLCCWFTNKTFFVKRIKLISYKVSHRMRKMKS